MDDDPVESCSLLCFADWSFLMGLFVLLYVDQSSVISSARLLYQPIFISWTIPESLV